MEFIELADYPLPTGWITEWQPISRTYWADWPRDSRAVSYNHLGHLRDALDHSRIRTPRHSWLGHVFRIEERLDADAWRAALDSWVDGHDALRSHVTIEGGQPVRYTAPPGNIRMRAVDIGRTKSMMRTYRLVHRLLDESTSPLRWPAHLCITIAEPEAFTVVLAADHSIIDGYSTVAVGDQLRAHYAAQRTGASAKVTNSGSYLDFSQIERERAAATTADHPGVRAWRDFLTADHGDAESVGGPLNQVITRPCVLSGPGGTPSPGPQRGLAIEVLDAAGCAAAEAAARAQGQPFAAVLLAAFAAAATEFGAEQNFRTVIPMHTRDEPRWQDSLGWYVGLAPFRLACAGVGAMAELVTAAGAELRRVRGSAAVPFGRVCELTGLRPRISFMVSYMDLRALTAHNWADSGTRWLRSRNSSPEEFYFWFVRMPTGVTLSMRYPATAAATHDTHRHVLRLRDILAEYARTGDVALRTIERV
ncbi:condensation domain-containing protein [Nocardia sp. NPDC127579]|uniref:condensation domain-containing protein n=1 Tax=Nocardia sp. NPDC127579 TaxID=3345402 RepID=UPI00362DAD16